jgi:hypothetical protein
MGVVVRLGQGTRELAGSAAPRFRGWPWGKPSERAAVRVEIGKLTAARRTQRTNHEVEIKLKVNKATHLDTL